MNRWGTAAASDFDAFLGVFWHDVEKILRNPSAGKMPPPEYRCTFRIDLGWTTPKRKQSSWKVTATSDLTAIGHRICRQLDAYGVPWLAYRSDLRNALKTTRYLQREQDGNYTSHELVSAEAKVLFMSKLGKTAHAKRELSDWLTAGISKREIGAFAKRAGISF